MVWALVARGGRGRGLEPHRAARRSDLCAELGRQRRSPSPTRRDYELIVNTTAVGLRGEDPFDAAAARAGRLRRRPDRRRHGLRRRAEPRCSRAAEAAGATVVDGLEILVQQGALSLRIWTGREPPLDVMRAAARG